MANRKGHRRFGSVRPLPSGRYQARYFGPDGIERKAPHTFAKETQAAKWLTLKEAEILKGDWVAPEAEGMLFGPYAEKWLKERKLKDTTRSKYKSIYKLHIGPHLARLALGAIKPSTIRTWRANQLAAGCPEIQAVKAYRIARAIFNTAIKEDEILKQNPCRIPGFDVQPSTDRPPVEIEQIEALAEEMPAQFYALIMLAAYSGLRWGELVALRRADVDLKNATVHVWRNLEEVDGKLIFGPPKSKAGVRKVSLPSSAVEVLRMHLDLNVGKGPESMLFLGEKGCAAAGVEFPACGRLDRSGSGSRAPGGIPFPRHATRRQPFGGGRGDDEGAIEAARSVDDERGARVPERDGQEGG